MLLRQLGHEQERTDGQVERHLACQSALMRSATAEEYNRRLKPNGDISMEGDITMEVRIEAFDDIEIARVRHVGPYSEVGPCFERLFGWLAAIGARPGRVLGIYHDDPGAVAPERLRADACVEVRTDASPPPGIVIDTIAAGRYAVYTHRGPYDGLPDAYKLLYGVWLPQSGEEVGDRPCLEMYHNSPVDTAPAQLVTDVCLPLRAKPNG